MAQIVHRYSYRGFPLVNEYSESRFLIGVVFVVVSYLIFMIRK